jgi:chondroitin AC lyase
MMFRETRAAAYLDAAVNMAQVFIRNLPEDLVPFWDFNAGEEGYVPGVRSYAVEYGGHPKDASAAAIVCSALFELDGYAPQESFADTAVRMLRSLASPAYRAPIGENANFLLMHCTGSIPHKFEIDAPIVYADYYFLEALVRYSRLGR